MSRIKTLSAKRYMAVFMAMLITVLSLSYTNNKAEAFNGSRYYYVYDAKTAEKIDEYLLPQVPYSINSRSIIGNYDERVIDWTKSGVVKIMSSNYYLGTGFVVNDHVIATAAHCVYNKKISEILLFDNNGNVTLHATPVEYHVPYLFTLPTDKENLNYDYDYALISVKEDLSDYACFDLGSTLDTFADNNPVVTVTGFPETIKIGNTEKQVNNYKMHNMYSGNGTVVDLNGYKMGYEADSSSGNSGGPVYITESLHGRTYYTIVAIHTYSGTIHNGGVRMTTDLINFYKANQAIYWE